MGGILGLPSNKLTAGETETLSDEHKAQLALSYAVGVISIWTRNSEVYIPFLDEPVMSALSNFSAVHQTVGYERESEVLVGYKTADIELWRWLELYQSGAKAAHYIRLRLSKNVELSYPMPPAASEFSALLLSGAIEEPAPPQKKKSKLHRDTLLAGIAKKVSSTFDMPIGAVKTKLSIDPPPICGCVISAAALYGFGVVVNFPRADTISRRTDLPIEIAAKNHVFSAVGVQPLPSNFNYLNPIPPDEFRTNASKRLPAEYEKASARLGRALPIFDDNNSG
jgi:hypothetical protein